MVAIPNWTPQAIVKLEESLGVIPQELVHRVFLGEDDEAEASMLPEAMEKTTYFIRKTTYSNRKFDIIDGNKWLI